MSSTENDKTEMQLNKTAYQVYIPQRWHNGKRLANILMNGSLTIMYTNHYDFKHKTSVIPDDTVYPIYSMGPIKNSAVSSLLLIYTCTYTHMMALMGTYDGSHCMLCCVVVVYTCIESTHVTCDPKV